AAAEARRLARPPDHGRCAGGDVEHRDGELAPDAEDAAVLALTVMRDGLDDVVAQPVREREHAVGGHDEARSAPRSAPEGNDALAHRERLRRSLLQHASNIATCPRRRQLLAPHARTRTLTRTSPKVSSRRSR